MSVASGCIVVGVDGSSASVDALRWAREESAARRVGVVVAVCWSLPAAPWFTYVSEDDRARGATHAEKVADTAVEAVYGPEPPPNEVRVEVVEGTPAVSLLALDDAVMLVVGSRGHGGFAGLLLGSVSQHLAQHARCPVVVIHASQA